MKQTNPAMAGLIIFVGVVGFVLSVGVVQWAAVHWLGQKPEMALSQTVIFSLWPSVGLVRWVRQNSKIEWPEWGHECLWLALLGAVVGLIALLPTAPRWVHLVAVNVWGFTVGYFVIIAVLHPILIRVFKAKAKQPSPGTE